MLCTQTAKKPTPHLLLSLLYTLRCDGRGCHQSSVHIPLTLRPGYGASFFFSAAAYICSHNSGIRINSVLNYWSKKWTYQRQTVPAPSHSLSRAGTSKLVLGAVAKPPAPSGWKRIRLPAPSSRRVVFSLLGIPPGPCPYQNPPPKPAEELRLTAIAASCLPDPGASFCRAGGRYRLISNQCSFPGRCGPFRRRDSADCPWRCDFLSVCCAPAHRSSRILQRNKKKKKRPAPHPPKSETSSVPLKSANGLLMNLLSHPRGRSGYCTADMQISEYHCY